ncbi:MAG: hypothetical protein WKF96_03100 [Solirubrobacteraceae bacterium]
MVELYRELKGFSQKERLAWGKSTLKKPAPLAARFAASLDEFESYDNQNQTFHDGTRKPLPKKPTTIRGTNSVAALLAKRHSVAVPGNTALSFEYVDRELVAARTTGGAKFTDGGSATKALRLDLLLKTGDGVPIIGEVKIAMDKDPVFALVQLLTLAAHLGTGKQRQRLVTSYHNHGLKSRHAAAAIDLYLCLANPPARATHWFDLRALAGDLSERLLREKEIGDRIRRIVCLDFELRRGHLAVLPRFAFGL